MLVITTDDVGIAAASKLGGRLPTPNLDRLAAIGLAANKSHNDGLCSQTRAALLNSVFDMPTTLCKTPSSS